MSLDDIVSVDITISSSGLTGEDFGTPFVLAHLPSAVETIWAAERVRTYTSAAAMLAGSEGFSTTDSAYKLVAALFSQNPKPAKVKVGRRALKATQILHLTPTITTVGHIYTWKSNGTTISYTVLVADDTVAKIVAKLVTATTSEAPSGVTATDGTTHVILTSTAGKIVEHTDFGPGISLADASADPGAVTDLTACRAVDDSWYFLLSDAFGAAEIAATAAHVETLKKVYVAQTADSAALGTATSGIAYTLHGASTFRTSLWYHKNYEFKLAAGIVGNRSTVTPGTDTWFGKTVVGPIPSDELTATQIQNLRARNVNYTQTIGVSRTLGGWVSGGEYADNVRGIDALRSDMQIAVAGEIFAASKIPNTNAGRSRIKGAIENVLKEYTSTEAQPHLLSPDTAPVLTMPPTSDTTSFNAVTRILSGVTFTATLANAIHAVQISGTLSE